MESVCLRRFKFRVINDRLNKGVDRLLTLQAPVLKSKPAIGMFLLADECSAPVNAGMDNKSLGALHTGAIAVEIVTYHGRFIV
jgi:hypothetical protein